MTPSQMSHVTTVERAIEIDHLTLVRGMMLTADLDGGEAHGDAVVGADRFHNGIALARGG
jgi:hypothetical protein